MAGKIRLIQVAAKREKNLLEQELGREIAADIKAWKANMVLPCGRETSKVLTNDAGRKLISTRSYGVTRVVAMAAAQKLYDTLAAADESPEPDGGPAALDVETYRTNWLSHLEQFGTAKKGSKGTPKTRDGYRSRLSQLLALGFGSAPVTAWRPEDLTFLLKVKISGAPTSWRSCRGSKLTGKINEPVFRAPRKGEGKDPIERPIKTWGFASATNVHAVMDVFMDYLVEHEGLSVERITSKASRSLIPSKGDRPNSAFTASQAAELLDAAADDMDKIGQVGTLFIPVALVMYVGIRIEEALKLTWDDVDLDARRIFVPLDKAKRTSRTHSIPAQAMIALLRVREDEREGYLFWKETVRGPNTGLRYYALKRVCATAKLDYGFDKNAGWRKLRRTFANLLDDMNVPIFKQQKIFGHANVQTTAGYHTIDDQDRDDVAAGLEQSYNQKGQLRLAK